MNDDNESQDSATSGVLSIAVTDFGPIIRANVDLRPLTVFVGPSNTGKSYLAILLYALHRCFRETVRWVRDPFSLPRAFDRRSAGLLPTPPLPTRARGHFDEWLQKEPTAVPRPLPADVADHVRTVLEGCWGIDRRLEQEVGRCFGEARIRRLVRAQANGGGCVALGIPPTIGDAAATYRLEFGDGDTHLYGGLPEAFQIDHHLHEVLRSNANAELIVHVGDGTTEGLGRADRERGLDRVFDDLVESIFESLVEPISDAHYLPADRTGVIHSHQVVVSTLLQHATTAGLRPPAELQVPSLSGVLADFLGKLVEMSGRTPPGHDEQDPDLGARLENNVLQGAIRLNRSVSQYPTYSYRPAGWTTDVPLMRASSMVSELAPVVLYLRHLVQPGELLIIEEPEAHLHPGMQAAFTRELARMVKAGVRVVITTHSEWLLEQLGNLVRLSQVPEGARHGLAGADCALERRDVGAWLFSPSDDSQGAVVKEVALDPETGLYPTDYDKVSELLYNDSATIFNRIQEHPAG